MLLTSIDRLRGGGLRPSPRRRRPVVLAALAALVAIAALLVGLLPAAPEPAADDLPRLRRLPPIYQAIYYRPEVKALVDQAQTRLITPCMAAHGLTYRPGTPMAPTDDDAALLRPFGVESLRDHPPPATSEPETTRPDDERYARALYGERTARITARGAALTVSAAATGCQAEAERRLLGYARARHLELRIRLYEAESTALDAFTTDPEFDRVRQAWRACMRRAGITAADPAEVLDGLPAGVRLADDVTVRADLACKARTGYLRRAYTRMAELQRTVLAGSPQLLTEWDARQRQQVAAARAVLFAG